MRDLEIPASPEAHLARYLDLLGPLGYHPHWRRLAYLIVSERAPLLYAGNLPGENLNLSMWFGLLDRRDGRYDSDPTGVIRPLYIAHELSHLLSWTPTNIDRESFADAFHRSERLASYETELRVYVDLPELLDVVPFRPLLARWLLDRGVDLADAPAMIEWRDCAIDDAALLAELPSEAARLGGYSQTREWARDYWDRLDRLGWWGETDDPPTPTTFEPLDYRERIAKVGDDAAIDPTQWERLIIRNVERAHVLCGLERPDLETLDDARAAAATLDDRPLATRDTMPLRTESTR